MTDEEPKQEPPARSGLWTVRLGLLVTPHFFGSFSLAAIASMAPAIKQDLNFTYTDIGLIMATYSAVQAIFGIPGGISADRLGLGVSIFFGFALLGGAAFMFSQADTLNLCLLAAGLMGMGYAFMNPSTAKAVFDWFPQDRRATAASLKQTGVPIAWMAGALAFPLSDVVHWQWIMLGIAVMNAATGLIYVPMIGRPSASTEKQSALLPLSDIWGIIKNRSVAALEINGFLYHAGQQNLYSFMTLFMNESLRAGSGVAAVALQLVQAGSILGRIGFGAISDFLLGGKRKIVLLVAAFVSAFGVCGLAFLDFDWGVYAALILAFILGFTLCSGSPIYQTAVMEAVEPRLSGTAVGYSSTVMPAGKALGTAIFGVTVDAYGFASAWLLTGVLILIAALVLMKFYREPDTKTASSP